MRKYPLIFFFIAFFGNYFFFRGRSAAGFLTFFSISRKKKDEKTENLSKT